MHFNCRLAKLLDSQDPAGIHLASNYASVSEPLVVSDQSAYMRNYVIYGIDSDKNMWSVH